MSARLQKSPRAGIRTETCSVWPLSAVKTLLFMHLQLQPQQLRRPGADTDHEDQSQSTTEYIKASHPLSISYI